MKDYNKQKYLKLLSKEYKNIKEETKENLDEWYTVTLYRLVEVARKVSSKYTRSKVRKAIKNEFAYIIDELLHAQINSEKDKVYYYKQIIKTIIELGQADSFIIAISELIKQMAVDHLHVIGDIFDRGRYPNLVIEKLMNFHSLDIQWGNHDILWMGATLGNQACIATVVRNSARYNNIETLEDAYGINIRPLSTFAQEAYKNDNCEKFLPKEFDYNKYDNSDRKLIAKIHKAITIIQFKLEGQMIKKHPEYNLNDRLLLDKMDLKKGFVLIDGKKYEINDTNFPTINQENPYELTSKEKEVMDRLTESFIHSPSLNNHINFLFSKGEMYTVFNNNLLFHGCIPMNEDGTFKKVQFLGKELAGKAYFDEINEAVNKAYMTKQEELIDIMWFLWLSPESPFFGKDKMATFESYFVKDAKAHKENKNPYYTLSEDEKYCNKILKEFGLEDEDSRIVNGHIPVKVKDGESPIKANGKLLIIDGGFAKSFREKTGNAGYVLTYNSNGLLLSQTKPFESVSKAIIEEKDIISEIIVKKNGVVRKTVGDTDIGTKLKGEIEDLMELLNAYKNGEIKENWK